VNRRRTSEQSTSTCIKCLSAQSTSRPQVDPATLHTHNYKKSCCLGIGLRYDVKCADVVILSGRILSRFCELRYLGVYVSCLRQFKMSLQNAKRLFYRAANSIFGKIARIWFCLFVCLLHCVVFVFLCYCYRLIGEIKIHNCLV